MKGLIILVLTILSMTASGQFLITAASSKAASCGGTGQVLDGVDQMLYLADNGSLDVAEAATDFCFCGWLTTGTDISTEQMVFGKANDVGINGLYMIYVTGGSMKTYVQGNSTATSLFDNITLATETEYFALVRIDITNSKVYFYIDNVLQNAGGSSIAGTFGSMSNDYEYVVGARNYNSGAGYNRWFGGTVRDVRVYHKDVSGDQVALMNGEELGDEKVWYCLSNSNFTDLSGNENDLTDVNL